MKIGILCTSCAALILSLQHSLEGKVLETTELSDKIALLETQLASTHDVCKGYTFSSLLPCFCNLLEGHTLAWKEVIYGYLQAPAIIPHQITIAYCCHALSKSRT
jgi:hypothetical protein